MKPHIAPAPGRRETASVLPRCIAATDLIETPAARPRWRRRTGEPVSADRPGWASPMGFWLDETHEPTTGTALRIELASPLDVPTGERADEPTTDRRRRPSRVVRVKGPNAADGDLVLTIGPDSVRVVSSAATWQHSAEPVLLAVCQYWRFMQLDAQLDRLTEQAAHDVPHAAMSIPATLWDRSRLLATARDVRTLLLDLPHFMEPLTDPFAFCSSERSVQVYRALAEKLELEGWCEAIDDRAEMVEDTYACVTEKLFEYRNFAWGALLEVTIVVLLFAELTFQLWAHFATP